MNAKDEFVNKLNRYSFDKTLNVLYGKENLSRQRLRFRKLVEGFAEVYGHTDELLFFSSPGRVEIIGNHTDHNNGCALATTVGIDMISAVKIRNDSMIRIRSEGYSDIVLDLKELNRKQSECLTPAALIRGISADFKAKGYRIGGFDAYFSSDLIEGAGTSSSASLEIMIGTIYNKLFNKGCISNDNIAQSGMTAETKYFGKPSGLMDQLTIATGGLLFMDFNNPLSPVKEQIPFDFGSFGLAICLVHTGDNHAEQTDEYASIPDDMNYVSKSLNKAILRDVSYQDLLKNMRQIRQKCGDLALLRAFHFVDENERVRATVDAIKQSRKDEVLRCICQSGTSSALYLQNVYKKKSPYHQNISIALYLAEKMLRGKGAWRIHGGGFGGTTFNLVPFEQMEEFASFMEQAFGSSCCQFLHIRPVGGICIKENYNV